MASYNQVKFTITIFAKKWFNKARIKIEYFFRMVDLFGWRKLAIKEQ